MLKLVLNCIFSMFNDEENDLFQDMKSLPHNSFISKLNHIGKRANTAIVSINNICIYILLYYRL